MIFYAKTRRLAGGFTLFCVYVLIAFTVLPIQNNWVLSL